MSALSKTQQEQLLAQKLFRKRKSKSNQSEPSTGDHDESKSTAKSKKSNSDDSKATQEKLTEQAIAEIQRDTKRAAELAEKYGTSGWNMKSTQKTNKRFLANTMRSVINHNKRTTVQHAAGSKRKFDEITKRPPKFGQRLHSFQNSNERLTKTKDDS